MEINRREFGKLSIIAGGLSFLPLATGCTITAAEVQADGEAVANAILAVAALETGSLATNLTTAAQTLLTATKNWTTGSATTDINTAAIALEAVLAVIPQTAAIAPLIPIAVAAIDILIANLPVGANGVAGRTVAVSNNPYRGVAHIHHRLLRSPEGDFKAAWNGVVKTHPALKAAEIK